MAWTPAPPLDDLLLRPAHPGDGFALVRLYRHGFRAYGDRSPACAALREVVVAELSGEVVGFGRSSGADVTIARLVELARARRRRSQGVATDAFPTVFAGDHVMSALVVAPRHRRRGIGRRLTEARLEAAELAGAHHVFVHCVQGSGSAALYSSLGFRTLVHIPMWYPGGQAMTFMMRSLPM